MCIRDSYYGFDEQLNKTIEFLRTGNYLNVDIFALKRANDDKLIAPLGTVPYKLCLLYTSRCV